MGIGTYETIRPDPTLPNFGDQNTIERNSSRKLKCFIGEFDRPNLFFEVRRKPDIFNHAVNVVIKALEKYATGSAIIYCFSQSK